MTEEPGSGALCLSCGLCCDGTLFARVRLHAGDALPSLRAGGIKILTRPGGSAFEQPCAALHQRRCTVYAERPSNCRTFRCELLKCYEAGNLSWSEARTRIDRAHDITAAIRIELARVAPNTLEGPVPPGQHALIPPAAAFSEDPALRRRWAPVLMRMSALLDLVRTHFLPPGSRGSA
jgi:Fe-S-cluster containining protein